MRRFSRQYDCDLIQSSHEGIILGTMVWDTIFSPPKFAHDGMPDHILDGLRLRNVLTDLEYRALFAEIKAEPLLEGDFAGIELEVDVENVSQIDHPKIGELSESFEFKKAESFRFSQIKMRRMPNISRVLVARKLDKVKESDWKWYREHLRKPHLITELYYGAVEVLLKREVEAEFEGKLQSINLEASSKTSFDGTVNYRFDNDKVPFAMRIERLRNFT